MIVAYLTAFVLWMARLVIPAPPKPKTLFDVNGICPACRTTGRTVECIIKTVPVKQNNPVRTALLMWTCPVCKGYTFTKTCTGDNGDLIHGREIVGL